MANNWHLNGKLHCTGWVKMFEGKGSLQPVVSWSRVLRILKYQHSYNFTKVLICLLQSREIFYYDPHSSSKLSLLWEKADHVNTALHSTVRLARPGLRLSWTFLTLHQTLKGSASSHLARTDIEYHAIVAHTAQARSGLKFLIPAIPCLFIGLYKMIFSNIHSISNLKKNQLAPPSRLWCCFECLVGIGTLHPKPSIPQFQDPVIELITQSLERNKIFSDRRVGYY